MATTSLTELPTISETNAAASARSALAIAHVIRSWRTISAGCVLGGLLAAGLVLVIPRRYDSHFSFVPRGTVATQPGGKATLLSIAQGLGIPGLTGSNEGLDYFTALLKSRTLVERVLLHPLPPRVDPKHPDASNLLLVLGVDPDRFEYSLEEAVEQLRNRVRVEGDPAAGVISVTISAHSPMLAQEVGKVYLAELMRLNSAINHGIAVQQLRFLEEQRLRAQSDLYTLEDTLKAFYTGNRNFSSSPTLAFEESRLKRRIDVLQSLYVLLSQQSEQAKIDAAKELPAFTVLDPPPIPVVPSFPKRRQTVLLVFVLAGLATAAGVFLYALVQVEARTPASPIAILEAATQDAVGEAKALYRRVVGRTH